MKPCASTSPSVWIVVCDHAGDAATTTASTRIASVAAVIDGSLKYADASWWGFNSEDTTDVIQAAIDSGAPKVIIPFMGEPWIVRPLKMRSDLELILEPVLILILTQLILRTRLLLARFEIAPIISGNLLLPQKILLIQKTRGI